MWGLAGFPSPASQHWVACLHRPDTDRYKQTLGLLEANSALAVARLAQAAADRIVVTSKADAYQPSVPNSPWGGGACPLGYTKADQFRYLKVGMIR